MRRLKLSSNTLLILILIYARKVKKENVLTLCHQVESEETQVKNLNNANKILGGVRDYVGMTEVLQEAVPFKMPVRLGEPTNSYDVESVWILTKTREFSSEVL